MARTGDNPCRCSEKLSKPVGVCRGHEGIVVGAEEDYLVSVTIQTRHIAPVRNVVIEVRQRGERVDEPGDQYKGPHPPCSTQRSQVPEHGEAAETVRDDDGVFVHFPYCRMDGVGPVHGIRVERVRERGDGRRDAVGAKAFSQPAEPVVLWCRCVAMDDRCMSWGCSSYHATER